MIARQRANGFIHDIQALLKDYYIFFPQIVGFGAGEAKIEDKNRKYNFE